MNFNSSKLAKMSEDTNPLFDTIQYYENLLASFDQLTNQEILAKLHGCANKIQEIPENLEMNHSLAINSLKQEVLNQISQFECYVKSVKNKSGKGFSIINAENEKLYNAVRDTLITPRTKGLSDIVGLNDIKATLITFIVSPIKQPQLYNDLGFNCNCILLFGPPGTGKTFLADAIAAEAKANLLSVTASSILSHYVGQSEKMLKSLFNFVQNEEKETILFIDEIDGLCRKRQENEHEHSRRLKTEFMCQISNFEMSRRGYLICATNCPWELDAAFIRRFQKRLYVPLPDLDSRLKFLELYTQNTPLANTYNNWLEILCNTEGFSGCDMVHLIQTALTIPIIELQKHKVWKVVDEKYYEPFLLADNFEGNCNIHFGEFVNLPPKSVRGRKAEFRDLKAALSEVKRTVSDEDVKKYEAYISRY